MKISRDSARISALSLLHSIIRIFTLAFPSFVFHKIKEQRHFFIWYWILSAFVLINLNLAVSEPVATFAQTEQVGLGGMPPDTSQRTRRPASAVPIRSNLPSKVDYTAFLPPVGNQGGQNSCTAWATAYYYKTFQENKKFNWAANTTNHQFSPAFIYNQVQKSTGRDNEGMFASEAINLMVNSGADTLASFPYNQYNYTTQPTAAQLANAANYKAATSIPLWYTNDSIDILRQYLANGDVFVLDIPINSQFWKAWNVDADYVVTSNAGTPIGYHEITVVGYDDTKGAFKIVNSWGTSWGNGGYIWLSYNFVLANAVMADGMTNRDQLAFINYPSSSGNVVSFSTNRATNAVIKVNGTTVATSSAANTNHSLTISGLAQGTYDATVTLTDASGEFTSASFRINTAAVSAPTGEVSSASCTNLTGWAWDPKSPNVSIDVQIYKDGPSGTGTLVQSITANLLRADIRDGVSKDNGLHGFDIPTPNSLKDGVSHTLYFYAIATGGAGPNSLINNSPATINCSKPISTYTVGQGAVCQQNFVDAYNRSSVLGQPSDVVKQWGTTGIYWQPFSGGGIFHDQTAGGSTPCTIRAFGLYSDILTRYTSLTGPASYLGAPTSDEFGAYQSNFVGGYIISNGTVQDYAWPNSFSGWKAQYFNNANLLSGPSLVRNEVISGSNSLNFTYTWPISQALMPTQGLTFADGWSARWERTSTFASGTYTFTLCGGGARLYISSTLVIDQWKDQGLSCYDYTQTNATTTSVPIKIDYYKTITSTGITFSVASTATTSALATWVVKSSTESGGSLDVNTQGSLSYALNMAAEGDTIIFDSTVSKITVSGKLPALKAGVKIQGRCSAGKPEVTIEGYGLSGLLDSMTLSGHNTLYGVKITKFSGQQIKAIGGGNKLSCVAVTK